MDLKDDLLLTVSWEKEDQIQLFDLRMNKKIGVFQMNIKENNNENNKNKLDNVSYLYSCRFNPTNNTFCVTGSNKNYLRIYDYNIKGNKLVYGSAKTKIDFLNLI